MVCVSSTAAGAQPGGSCNVLEVEYDASGQRIRERAGATTRYFLGDDLSHVPAEASPGGIAETRIEIEAFGERVGVRLLEGGRIFNGETGPWGVGRPLPLPFPPALLVWALAVLAITAYVAACLLGARIGGDPLGAPVGGTVALIAMVALILPPSAWAGATGPPEGTVVYRAVLSDPLGSGSVLLDGSGDRVRHTVFRPFGAVYEEVGPGFGTSRLDRRYFAGHASQEETGLVYMQARWLDPEVGRFLSVDPLIRSLAKPQSLNGYSYVENNPTRFNDPTGMTGEEALGDPFEGVPEGPGATGVRPSKNSPPSANPIFAVSGLPGGGFQIAQTTAGVPGSSFEEVTVTAFRNPSKTKSSTQGSPDSIEGGGPGDASPGSPGGLDDLGQTMNTRNINRTRSLETGLNLLANFPISPTNGDFLTVLGAITFLTGAGLLVGAGAIALGVATAGVGVSAAGLGILGVGFMTVGAVDVILGREIASGARQ